ncbi:MULTISPECIES: hypothetical protein [Mycobacterium]|uniref:Lipopolysaccharide assembly protein A domain-containing protein n=2 Tax=Mycobacterium TaxID=1763 RepID=A0A1Y0CEG7_9MYCO|nr:MULTISPECIES: hypothetical protein [Mycobacterium]ART73651.1 hypothetical protein BTO20_15885 [Mycobacterium dioxanotrophicus]ORA29956.1 hypothetical protein BST13_26530 [Mycobacterium aquaticum]
MVLVIGLVVLLVAVVVGFTGVLANAGPAHPLTENFDALGYHLTGSTGTLFVFGIAVGAVAMQGLNVLLAGARRTARRGRAARRDLAKSRRETAFLNEEHDRRIEHDHDDAVIRAGVAPSGPLAARETSRFGRWWHGRQPIRTAGLDTVAGRPAPADPLSPRSRAIDTEDQGVRNERR